LPAEKFVNEAQGRRSGLHCRCNERGNGPMDAVAVSIPLDLASDIDSNPRQHCRVLSRD
jgi:hypothetical protein